MTSPPARAAARLVRSIDSLTFALFALMGPPSLIVAGLVLSAPRTPRWSEIVALVLVHALTTLNVVLPVAVVLFNGFFTQRPTNQLVQLCAVHFVWNAHVMGHTVMCLPFLVHKYASHGITHAEVVYDVATFWMFVAWPLQLSTGVLKAVVARKQQRFDWKHRALLGVALINITLFYAVGTYYVRPKTFRVHVACTMAFYGYGISSMLPASPQGDGPEITGAREWPALKLWLRPFLWEPIREYMQMRIILDAGSAPDAVSAARSASQVDLLKLAAAATKSHADAKSRAVAARLDAAEAHVVAALAELGALADATPEVHRIADALRESVRLLERRSEATRRGADGALRDGEAALFGFHVHGIIPFNAGIMTYVEEWQALLPAQHIVLATDAFTHSIVWMRDIGQWLGARECTSACIGKTLDGGTSILLVPGGQAEIFNAQSWGTTVAVHKSHKGFIKLALRHRARLVPVFSFGEWEMMDNISLPWLQRHSRKLLGFPFPFLPYGRFWLPLPRRPPHGITIVVGRPVDVEYTQVDDSAVDRCHAKYFDALHDLFERHKTQAGYPVRRRRLGKATFSENPHAQDHTINFLGDPERRPAVAPPPESAAKMTSAKPRAAKARGAKPKRS